MKILHISETAIGGVGSYLNNLNDPEDNISNVYLVPEGHAHVFHDSLNVRSYASSGRNLKSIWAHIHAVRTAVMDEEPDILFFHSSFSLLGLAAIRILGERRPAIYCSHGWAYWVYEGSKIKSRIVRFIEGTLAGLSSRVINISRTDQNLAERLGYFGTHLVIENGVPDINGVPERTYFRGDCEGETDEINLLFVGRFDRQKGLDLLLPAFSKVREQRSDLRLHIVGASVRADGGEISLPEGAILHGWVSREKIDDLYASAEALVVPSRWESFGLVVAEAMRNGTPVLCSDCGALPTLVEPGRTGAVFSLEGDSLELCLASLKKTELAAWRPTCRSVYEKRFTAERMRRQIRALYTELLTGPRRRRARSAKVANFN